MAYLDTSGGRMGKVMIIDDCDLILAVTKDSLEAAGFEVITANSPLGTSAMIVAEKPDVVLLDVNMPALTGDKLVSIIRRSPELGQTKVVLFSETDSGKLSEMASSCGADGAICKGDNQDLVVTQVRNFMSTA